MTWGNKINIFISLGLFQTINNRASVNKEVKVFKERDDNLKLTARLAKQGKILWENLLCMKSNLALKLFAFCVILMNSSFIPFKPILIKKNEIKIKCLFPHKWHGRMSVSSFYKHENIIIIDFDWMYDEYWFSITNSSFLDLFFLMEIPSLSFVYFCIIFSYIYLFKTNSTLCSVKPGYVTFNIIIWAFKLLRYFNFLYFIFVPSLCCTASALEWRLSWSIKNWSKDF